MVLENGIGKPYYFYVHRAMDDRRAIIARIEVRIFHPQVQGPTQFTPLIVKSYMLAIDILFSRSNFAETKRSRNMAVLS